MTTKVPSELIANDAVGADQLASNAVVTASIVDDAITGAKIENAVTIATSVTSPLVDGQNFKVNGGQGSDGQVLTSTGSGVAWEDASGGVAGIVSNADATALTIDSSENLILTAGGTIRAGGANDLILDAGESGTPDIYLQSGGATKVKIEGSNGGVEVGGNLSLGQTINAHSGVAQYGAIEFPRGELMFSQTNGQNQLYLASNLFINSSGSFAHRNTGTAVALGLDAGTFNFLTATSASANASATFSNRFFIAADGGIGIATTDTANAKLVINGTVSGASDHPMIDFDGYGTRVEGATQSINFRMGRTGQATDQPAQIKSIFQGGGATAAATSIGFMFTTISANTQQDQFHIDAAYQRFKFNTTESPRSNNPQTSTCIVIGNSPSTAVTAGLTNACVLINRAGELYAVDHDHNNTQITPHNWSLIPEGRSEELAWTYWSQRPNPDNPEELQGINVDITKVIRKVEDLVGEKLVYTENSNMDNHTHQNIIADIQRTLENLTTRIEALES